MDDRQFKHRCQPTIFTKRCEKLKKEILDEIKENGPKSQKELEEALGKEHKKSIQKNLPILIKKKELERLPTDPGKGRAIYKYYFANKFWEAVEICGVVPIERIDEYEKRKEWRLKSEGARTPWRLKGLILALKNRKLPKEIREKQASAITDWAKDDNLPNKTIEILENFLNKFLASFITNPDTWKDDKSKVKSELLRCHNRFTQRHLDLRILKNVKNDQQNKIGFFHKIIEVEVQREILRVTWYKFIKKIYKESQDNEVREKLFRILNRAYHIATERGLEESKELKALIESAFFSENYNENMFEDAWVTLISKWRDEKEIFKFLEKINHQVGIVEDMMLKDKFIEKIGDYALQSMRVIHRTKLLKRTPKIDMRILKKLRVAIADSKRVEFEDKEIAIIQELIKKN